MPEVPPPAPVPAPAPEAAPPPPVRRPVPARTTWLLAGVAAAGCAYVAVADPSGTASWYPGCPFRAATGLDCPGCGATRAVHAALTGHPLQALDHNLLLVVAAVVGVVWFGLAQLRRRGGRPPLRARNPGRVGIFVGVLVVAWWVARNLPWSPLAWLGSGA